MSTQTLTARIARQEWLKPVEKKLQKTIQKGFSAAGPRGQKAKNFLQGTWLGHPLHVILTDIPVGAWTAAVVFDLLDSVSGNEAFSTAADTSITIGLVSALAAAVTGISDWQDIDPPARRIGLMHAALNVSSVGLFTSSLFLRKGQSRGWGRAMALLGYTAMTAAARLGGNLVYEQRIGIDHSAGQAFPEEFVPVLRDSELPDGVPKRAMYNGVPILLVRRANEVFALAETCSHLGGPLSEGKIVDDTIQCPWHGSRFDLARGDVVDGPAVHPQPCLENRVRDGQIEVRKFQPRVAPVVAMSKPRAPEQSRKSA